jgi:hypothetical protein
MDSDDSSPYPQYDVTWPCPEQIQDNSRILDKYLHLHSVLHKTYITHSFKKRIHQNMSAHQQSFLNVFRIINTFYEVQTRYIVEEMFWGLKISFHKLSAFYIPFQHSHKFTYHRTLRIFYVQTKSLKQFLYSRHAM